MPRKFDFHRLKMVRSGAFLHNKYEMFVCYKAKFIHCLHCTSYNSVQFQTFLITKNAWIDLVYVRRCFDWIEKKNE